MLEVQTLRSRGGSFELGPIDLIVESDRVLTVLGPSGAGKTMLLETIAGFRRLGAGRVLLDGKDISALLPEERGVGFVFQDAALFPHLSVAENVRFALRSRHRTSVGLADELAERFAITTLLDRRPRTLSGGERQRVALARALAARPKLLLLDEPLSSVDQPTREELRVLQDVLSGLAIPAIHVTHDRDEALSIGDRLAVIVDGHIRQLEDPSGIVAAPADENCARLLGWSELGVGERRRDRLMLGELVLPADSSLVTPDGPVTIFYRPEAVTLMTDRGAEAPSLRLEATVKQVLPTVPLVRVVLEGSPAIMALLLARDAERLGLEAGGHVTVGFPPVH